MVATLLIIFIFIHINNIAEKQHACSSFKHRSSLILTPLT